MTQTERTELIKVLTELLQIMGPYPTETSLVEIKKLVIKLLEKTIKSSLL